ncbi:MAG: DNA alkylation repair protein [Chitinophagaceae bacterium]|nr:MAG: DNA alkylation repair protein [Chitinophagaceae bacterium]
MQLFQSFPFLSCIEPELIGATFPKTLLAGTFANQLYTMPEPLKNVYDALFLKRFASLAAVIPGFSPNGFQADVFDNTWHNLELKQRMRRLSSVLHSHLPGDYPAKVSSILRIISLLEERGENGGFAYMFLPDFIEQYGLNDPNTSLEAMERITQFASCEFAIRPFLVAYPEKVMAQMLAWSRHPHASVRRFASEGCRPRLPWAVAIPSLKKDPSPILPILENLKKDESLFVRRSVANNLNDIAKDHPGVVTSLVKTWKDTGPETDWVIRHGCRSLLKKANAAAYALFGLEEAADCRISDLSLSQRQVKIGGRLQFSFALKTGPVPRKIRLEYAVYYVKANGKQSRKIFQLIEKMFQPAQAHVITKEQRFQDFTTRKHYPGEHKLAIVLNGQEVASSHFLLQ